MVTRDTTAQEIGAKQNARRAYVALSNLVKREQPGITSSIELRGLVEGAVRFIAYSVAGLSIANDDTELSLIQSTVEKRAKEFEEKQFRLIGDWLKEIRKTNP